MKKLKYFLILFIVVIVFPLIIIETGVLIDNEEVIDQLIEKINSQKPLDSGYVNIVQVLENQFLDRGVYENILLEKKSSPCLQQARFLTTSSNRAFRILQLLSVARKLESKSSQLGCYTYQMNKFDFLYNNRGIHAASDFYFKKDVSDLNIEELIGIYVMTQNPVYFNPIQHKERYLRAVEKTKLELKEKGK